MRIALIALGPQHDIQPFCALAESLSDTGHDPVIVSNASHAGVVGRLGLRFKSIAGDTPDPLTAIDMARAGRARKRISKDLAWIEDNRRAVELGVAAGIAEADAVVSGPLVDDIAASLAELKRVPFILSGFAPHSRTPGVSNPLFGPRSLPFEALNMVSHRLADRLGDRLTWRPKAAGEAALRHRLGLPAQRRSRLWQTWASGGPFLGAWSPVLFPSPRGWGQRMDVTGTWRLSRTARAALGDVTQPPGLADWLAEGPEPIFLTLDALPPEDANRLLDGCAEIARKTGLRFLISTDNASLDDQTPAPGLRIEPGPLDHDWLFPHCRLVIHGGQAGLTDSTLRAGRPGLAIAHATDAPFWGSRLRVLGVGDHIPFARLDEARLAQAIDRLLAPEIEARAVALGASMHVENGATRAARAVNGWLEQRF